MRTVARLTSVLLLAALSAFVAGCGSDDASSSKTSGAERAATTKADDATTEGLVATVDANLEIRLENVGGKDFAGIPVPAGVACDRSSPATCQGTLTCPAATDDTRRIELCGWLASVADPLLLGTPDPAQACTQQYGGPEIATVTGTIGDQKVDATYSREDGCAIARFDLAAPLWTGEVPPAPPADAGGGPATGSCPALDPDAPVSSDDATPDPAAGAADGVCASSATSSQAPAPGAPPIEPEIISDPPEAFELEK